MEELSTNEKKERQSENFATMAKSWSNAIFDTGYVSAVRDIYRWMENHANTYGIDKANLKALLSDYKILFGPD